MAIPRPGEPLSAALDEADRTALREAADWHVRLHDGTPSEALRQQWQQWLDGSDRRAQAWAWMRYVNDRMSGLHAVPAASRVLKSRGRRRVVARTFALALGVGLAGSVAVTAVPWRAWGATYRAGIGQIERIVLEDGSILWLDTDSAVDVDFSPQARHLTLVRGRLFVETAPDRAPTPRPFVVATPHGRLRPLGTRFGVRLHEADTELAVFEGEVEAVPDQSGATVLRVPAGWASAMRRDRHAPLREASRAMEAWTRGVLVADNVRLADFIAELARYRRGFLSCHPDVADRLLVGSYPLHDIDGSLDAIARTLPVRIERAWPARIAVVPRDR